jgi:hypothetical protein
MIQKNVGVRNDTDQTIPIHTKPFQARPGHTKPIQTNSNQLGDKNG